MTMDIELLRLINESEKEQIYNRTAETHDNKAYLEMVNYVMNKLKP